MLTQENSNKRMHYDRRTKRIIVCNSYQSRLKNSEIEKRFSKIWAASFELEHCGLAGPFVDGLRISDKTYKGIKRRGKDYLEDWLKENSTSLSTTAMDMLHALCHYRRFTTWDELFYYLKDHNCGDLEIDRP